MRLSSQALKDKLWFFPKAFKKPQDYPIETFTKGGIYNIDIAHFLLKFMKTGQRNSDLNLYKIALYSREGKRRWYAERIFCDTNQLFILLKSEKRRAFYSRQIPLACIGFDLDGEKNSEIVVRQIQGVAGRQEDLSLFRWEKMLLTIVVDWAKHQSFKSIRVIQGKNQSWCNDSRKDSFFMKYDITARRSGFKFDPEKGNYALSLS